MVVNQYTIDPDAGSKDADNAIYWLGWFTNQKVGYTSIAPGSPSKPEPYANALSGMKSTPSLMM